MFQQLLERVAARFMQNHSPSSAKISEWKGQDIIDFQEDLRQQTQSSVSEKWFYNYVKNTPEKLPRIDILNLLSHYVGSNNWNGFQQEINGGSISIKGNSRKKWIYIGSIIALVLLGIYAYTPKEHSLQFCFIDADKKEPITLAAIDVIVLNEGESPSYWKSDSLGCITLKTKKDHIKFVAQSPYHKNDTIYKSVEKTQAHQVQLRTDDYALMLDFYTNGRVSDWEKRRKELNKLIADDAIIFELLPYQIGVELYSKEAFINKLSVPTKALAKLEIVETRYANGQIVKLKFKQQK